MTSRPIPPGFRGFLEAPRYEMGVAFLLGRLLSELHDQFVVVQDELPTGIDLGVLVRRGGRLA